jgi:hypothetical protein
MPIRARRPVSVFVRDDTVSIRQLMLAEAVPGFPPVFTVSFADVRDGPGLRDAAGPGRLQHELLLARGAPPRASWPS